MSFFFKCLNLVRVDFEFVMGPSVSSQPGLETKVGQEVFLAWELFPDLGEKSGLMIPFANDQPVGPGSQLGKEIIGIAVGERPWFRENAHLDLDLFKLALAERPESRISKGRIHRIDPHPLDQGFLGNDVTDTPSQGAVKGEGHEGPAPFLEFRGTR